MATYLVWSNEHHAYWKKDRAGYTPSVWRAGRYGLNDAQSCAATSGVRGRDVIVLAPESHRMLPLFSIPEIVAVEDTMRDRIREATDAVLAGSSTENGDAR